MTVEIIIYLLEDTTIKDVLKTVEAHYNQKDYTSALSLLQANKANISPGVWHYNVGTIYGKLDDWAMARYHFLLADWEGLSSKEVVSNRMLVEEKLDIQKLEKSFSPSDFFIKASIESSHGILTSLSLLFVLFGVICFWRKKSWKTISIFCVMSVMFVGLNLWILTWTKFISVKSQLIYDGPSVIFPTREELPIGILIVTRQKDDWLQVVYPSRFEGWVKFNGLKELK